MTYSILDLGWSDHFDRQWQPDPASDLVPLRIAEVHRDRLTGFGPAGDMSLTLPPEISAGDVAVGDWVLADAGHCVVRILDRQTLLSRRAAGTEAKSQLIAANVDTLFITSSCNADFNPARLERYLVLAHESGCFPVVLLTKADLADDPDEYRRKAEALEPMLTVLTVNALVPADLSAVAGRCGPGQTGALVGSSGVGKSTVMNALTGESQATQDVRQDARGRHTTTHRALRRMHNGGWLIDTPGMRALRLHDVAEAIEELFDDIAALAGTCRFSDCRHQAEPDCAVQAAVATGKLQADRLARWRKLHLEDARHTETLAQARARQKGFGKTIKTVQRDHKGRKGR